MVRVDLKASELHSNVPCTLTCTCKKKKKKDDSEKDSKNSVRPAMEPLCNNDVRD